MTEGVPPQIKLSQPKPPPLPPASPPPQTPSRVAAMRARASTTTGKELMFRIAVVVLLAASLVLFWFTYSKMLVPLQEQSREMSAALRRVGAEVDEMERRWSGGDAERLTTEFDQARAQVISQQPQLESWVTDLRQQVIPLALDANARFGASVLQATNEHSLALIPATISVQAQPARDVEGVESPYQRILRLTQSLLARQTRADLTQLTVSGGLNTVTKAELVLNLWAGEEGRE